LPTLASPRKQNRKWLFCGCGITRPTWSIGCDRMCPTDDTSRRKRPDAAEAAAVIDDGGAGVLLPLPSGGGELEGALAVAPPLLGEPAVAGAALSADASRAGLSAMQEGDTRESGGEGSDAERRGTAAEGWKEGDTRQRRDETTERRKAAGTRGGTRGTLRGTRLSLLLLPLAHSLARSLSHTAPRISPSLARVPLCSCLLLR